MPFARIK